MMSMAAKRVCVISPTEIFPVAAGHQKAIFEICRYLHASGMSVRLVVLSKEAPKLRDEYAGVCDEVRFVELPHRWSVWDVLNKITCRISPDVFLNFWSAVAVRHKVEKPLMDCDAILLNYVNWFPLVPKMLRKRKCIVITHDILFYRRQSFQGMDTFLSRFGVRLNRLIELSLLKSFKAVAVFGEYERQLLIAGGLQNPSLIKIGMPVQANGEMIAADSKQFDFITVGSNISQNVGGVECFFTRVAPLLPEGQYNFAVAGTLSDAPIWASNVIPSNFIIHRLGFVPDLAIVCARALIGVGTVPHGSGIKVKNVEMMMNGLPMLITNSGIEGIPVTGEGVINIDSLSPSEISARISYWLSHPQEIAAIGRQHGRQLRKDFSPDECLKGLVKCISSEVVP